MLAGETAWAYPGDTDSVTTGESVTVNVPWNEVVSALATCGWARAPEAVDAALGEALMVDNGRQWREAGDEGVVRQHVIGSYTPFDEALPVVRAVGDRLVAGLTAEARRQGLAEIPAFNEVTWGRYPAGRGHITAHRDPSAYGGVVAVFTLAGHARFRVWTTPEEVSEWETGPGQLVLLRGAGWPAAASLCPLHEVDPPLCGERMIMTFRRNSAGAGAGYAV